MALRKTEKDIELALTDCKSAHAKMLEISRYRMEHLPKMKSNGFEKFKRAITKQLKELKLSLLP